MIMVQCDQDQSFFNFPQLRGKKNTPGEAMVFGVLYLILEITQKPDMVHAKNFDPIVVTSQHGLRDAVVRIVKNERMQIAELHRAIPLVLFALRDSVYTEQAQRLLLINARILQIPKYIQSDGSTTLSEAISTTIGLCPEYNPSIQDASFVDNLKAYFSACATADIDETVGNNGLGKTLAQLCKSRLTMRELCDPTELRLGQRPPSNHTVFVEPTGSVYRSAAVNK